MSQTLAKAAKVASFVLRARWSERALMSSISASTAACWAAWPSRFGRRPRVGACRIGSSRRRETASLPPPLGAEAALKAAPRAFFLGGEGGRTLAALAAIQPTVVLEEGAVVLVGEDGGRYAFIRW